MAFLTWKITSDSFTQTSPVESDSSSPSPVQVPVVTPVPVFPTSESVPPEITPIVGADLAADVTPVSVTVESVGIETNLIPLGLNRDGTLEVPPDASISGWYTGGPKPGELGPAVIASHVSWNGVPGPFFNLGKVVVGDIISVVNSDDSKFRFEVIATATYAKNLFPTELVYGDLKYPGLHLITCDLYDKTKKSFTNNLVVYAKFIP